jgi:type II secretion system protein N
MAINLPKLPFKLPRVPLDRLGPRTRKVLRYVGFTFFGLFVFVMALQLTFPYERVKDKVVEAMSEKYEVTVTSVERGWVPGRVYFNGFSIRPRPTKPDEVTTPFFIKRLEIDAGLLSLIGGTITVDADALIGDNKDGHGHLIVHLELESFGRGNITASVEGDGVPGGHLPMRMALGLPMTGKLDFTVNAKLPFEKKSKLAKPTINWQKASGNLTLTCPSTCTFGDGKTKLKPLLKNTRNQVMVGEGIDFGKVTMDSLVAKATLGKGKLSLDKFDVTSKDGKLEIDYTMTLEKDFGESMVAGCLRFKGSDDLLRREPKTHAAISTTGAEVRGDGLFHIRLTDRFKDMKRLNQECGPNTKTGNGEDFNRPTNRPNLTIQPDPATPPPTTPTPTPTVPIPEQPPATPPAPPAPAAGAPGAPPTAGPPTGGDMRGERGEGRLTGDHGSAGAGSQTGEQPAAPPPAPPPE